MAYLDIRTAIATVEQALVEAISLGYQWRQPAVADIPALYAVPSVGVGGNAVADRALRFVQSEGAVYRWREYSRNADAPPFVIVPSDRTSPAGRWERQQSAVTMGPNHWAPVHRVQTGYAKAVQPWQGDEGYEEAVNRIFGQSPAFLVRWMEDEMILKGSPAGGVYEVDMPFQIWCFSRNLRSEWEALVGSPIASENAAEPGLWRMIGDLRYLLAGSDLGLSPGVRYVDIQGKAEIIEEDLAERKFVGAVSITVRAALNIPDEDLVGLDEIWVQHKDAQVSPSGKADPLNYLAQGGRIAPGAGLVGTPATPMVAYVNGQVVSVQVGAWAFPANADTYRDLSPGGVLAYTSVAALTDAPPQAPNTLRIGVTRTDDSNIIADALLCGYLFDAGEPYRAL